MQPPVSPVLINLGPLAIHWYGLLIVTGILLATVVTAYLARQRDQDPDHVWDMLLVVIVLGLVGARLYHVFSQPEGGLIGWSYYREHPVEILYLWNGGLGILGGVIGGALGVVLYSAFYGLSPVQWMDFAAPGVALGQAIGRWGNFINRELYGPPTDLPWGLKIPLEHRILPYTELTQYPPDTLFHPTFLYESLASLALFVILFVLGARHPEKLRRGDLVIGYLIGYSFIRFFTEMLRPDAWRMGGLAAAQVFSLIFFVVGVLFLVARHRFFARRSTET